MSANSKFTNGDYTRSVHLLFLTNFSIFHRVFVKKYLDFLAKDIKNFMKTWLFKKRKEKICSLVSNDTP